jgi:hypothetical protein
LAFIAGVQDRLVNPDEVVVEERSRKGDITPEKGTSLILTGWARRDSLGSRKGGSRKGDITDIDGMGKKG